MSLFAYDIITLKMKRSKMLGVGKKSTLKIKSQNEKGFTIVELLIATTVFSVIILVVSAGVIKIGNIYYKNITTTRTQNVVRSITGDISTTLQFSRSNPTAIVSKDLQTDYFCIDKSRYMIKKGQKYIKGNEFGSGMYLETLADTATSCADFSTAVPERRQLLGANMRVLSMSVDPVDQLATVKLKIAYGDDDLLTKYYDDGSVNASVDWADTNCKIGISGSSFCSIGQMDVTVRRML